jgi:hypothetical protein
LGWELSSGEVLDLLQVGHQVLLDAPRQVSSLEGGGGVPFEGLDGVRAAGLGLEAGDEPFEAVAELLQGFDAGGLVERGVDAVKVKLALNALFEGSELRAQAREVFELDASYLLHQQARVERGE